MANLLTKLLLSAVARTAGKKLLVLALHELAKRKDNYLLDTVVDIVAEALDVPVPKRGEPAQIPNTHPAPAVLLQQLSIPTKAEVTANAN